MVVAGAGWSLVAHVRMDGAAIAAIDVVVEKAFASRSFHLVPADLATYAKPEPRVVGIRDSDNELTLLFSTGASLERGSAGPSS
jgi:uncharacterized protein GlcG (DUF336 family)